jgi:hypothetical protein
MNWTGNELDGARWRYAAKSAVTAFAGAAGCGTACPLPGRGSSPRKEAGSAAGQQCTRATHVGCNAWLAPRRACCSRKVRCPMKNTFPFPCAPALAPSKATRLTGERRTWKGGSAVAMGAGSRGTSGPSGVRPGRVPLTGSRRAGVASTIADRRKDHRGGRGPLDFPETRVRRRQPGMSLTTARTP